MPDSNLKSNLTSSSVFRTNVHGRAGAQCYGTILLVRPLSHSLLTLLFLIIVGFLIFFFAAFSVARKAQVSGVLLPTEGMIRVVPVHSGVISERRVREGQHVRAGDVLFVLTSERGNAGNGSAEQTVSSLLQARIASLNSEQQNLRRQFTQRIADLRRRSSDLKAEIARIADQILLQQRRVALAEAAVKRYNDLMVSRFMSAVQVHEKQAELLDQQQRLGELVRTQEAVARDLGNTRYELEDAEIQRERESELIQRNITTVEQELTENEARRQVRLRASKQGIMTAIMGEIGQSIAPGQTIGAILPADAELEAHLYVNSRSAGFLRPGMVVRLRYQGYSFQKFGQHNGSIKEVSNTAMRPDELSLSGVMPVSGISEPLYRVRVKLAHQKITAYGIEHPLKSGALVDASIILETRRLYEWILDPLYTIIGRL